MLSYKHLTVRYGSLTALHDINLDVPGGRITAVLGHNGAGKSTLLHATVGGGGTAKGLVEIQGKAIRPGVPSENTGLGVGLVPQGQNVFGDLSVRDNLRIAGMRNKQSEHDRVLAIFPILAERRGQIASSLSGGQRQMLAVGMALMTAPRLLLLDEPTTGLSPVLVEQMFAAVQRANVELHTTVVVVEQNVRAALSIAHHVLVLKAGRIVVDCGVDDFDQSEMWKWF